MITARSIVKDTFWALEQDGKHFGILRRIVDDHFLVSSQLGEKIFQKKDELEAFGLEFFDNTEITPVISSANRLAVQGFPTNCIPYNPVYNIREKLPMFTKSDLSKSVYCAGYYIIRFDKGWVKSFCPKLITIERYPYKGPFMTEQELKQELANVKSD